MKARHGIVSVLIGAAALLAIPRVLADSGPAATPQRPSLSNSAWTVPEGLFELEAGAGFAEDAAGLPLFGKYGLTDRLELNAGIDLVRWVDGAGEGETSIGDLLLGSRWRMTDDDRRTQFALAGWLKVPTAGDETGSGELDLIVSGIASVPLRHGLGLDLNLVFSALGQDGSGTLGQGQAIATLGIPLEGRWSAFVETAYQRTAGQGDGGFVDGGLAFAASPRAVFDIATGFGGSDGYPDWTATVGWTVLFAP